MRQLSIQPGDKYNRLTAIKFAYIGNHHRSYYLFRCDCGTEKVLLGAGVKSGNTKSCGCLSREVKARRISNSHSEVTAIILGYKRHALSRDYQWDLSRDEVESIIFLPCYYCGAPPSNVKKTKNTITNGLFYSGIDRVDSKIGYHIDNVVPCCKLCNYAKSNLTLEEFKEWILRLAEMADQWG